MTAEREKVVLITYPEQHIIKEAIALATTAGYNVVDVLTQRYLKRAKYGLGKGKLEELISIIEKQQIDKVIFDETIRSTQAYNLAKVLKKEIIDRERLILQIFTKHALTREAKLQIKLAEQRYELVRAKDKVRLEKMGEQPGFFGLGEYEVDVYINQIKRQIGSLNRKLIKIRQQRKVQRTQREEKGIPLVSLSGYTGAGKTSLFNFLTGENLPVSERIFTTLRTTTRRVLGGKDVLISDTVGFIRKIPPYMIEAFKSTLEELKFADVVLLIVDISEPIEEVKRKYVTSLNILQELGIEISDVVIVLNKQDLVSENKIGEVEEYFRGEKLDYFVVVSSKTGYGIDELLKMIKFKIGEERKEYAIEYSIIPLISNNLDWLKQYSKTKTTKLENYLLLEVIARKTVLKRFEAYLEYARRNICTQAGTSNRT
ncbi:MAG: GTPase HflX [Nitrososphaeria archaeon]